MSNSNLTANDKGISSIIMFINLVVLPTYQRKRRTIFKPFKMRLLNIICINMIFIFHGNSLLKVHEITHCHLCFIFVGTLLLNELNELHVNVDIGIVLKNLEILRQPKKKKPIEMKMGLYIPLIYH